MAKRATKRVSVSGTNTTSIRTAINENVVSQLQSTGKQYFVRDSLLTGFAIRVSPKGKANYIVEARVKGKPYGSARRVTLGCVRKVNLKEARRRAVLLLSDFEAGIDPIQAKLDKELRSTTLSSLLQQFLSTKKLKPRTKRDYKADIEKYFKPLLNKPVEAIEPAFIRTWYISGANTPVSTDRAYRALKSILQYGVGMQVIDSNPAQSVTDMGIRYKPNKRSSFMSFEDVGLFLKAIIELSEEEDINTTIRDWLLLVLSTGLRSLESKGLLWDGVDFKGRRFTVYETKNSRELILPMTDTLYSMFTYQYRNKQSDEFVFSNRFGSGRLIDHRKTINKVFNRANIPHTTVHDLRRTFASIAEFIGVNQNIISIMLNHSTKNITEQYIQVQWPVVVEAMTKVEAFLNEQLLIATGGKADLIKNALYK